MKFKNNSFILSGLAVICIALNACIATQNQTPISNPFPASAASTSVPTTSTVTVTSTAIPTITRTISPTSWISALLTAAPTLMGSLSTLPPDCGKVNLGGAGTQTIEDSQKILIQGTAIICGDGYLDGNSIKPFPVVQAMLDLDTGTFDLESADLFFCPSGGSDTFYYYCEANNSKIREYGITLPLQEMEEPTFKDCSSVIGSHETTNDNEPVYVCVITNQGNVSRVKVEKYNLVAGTGSSEEISFITWENHP